ncbi:MAG: hypothetical protein A4S09_01005 [Proteobacteria bacterium SG_bin7]|nr:MAG: hypothetical protein A4S09_01005 [Proteobacteria bacterium SG_bin7]
MFAQKQIITFTAAVCLQFSAQANECRLFVKEKKSESLGSVSSQLYGGDIHEVTSSSLLGQYLTKTQASAKIVRVPKTRNGATKGPERLFVAVSQDSLNEFMEIFSNAPIFSVLGHANIFYRDWVYDVHGRRSEFRFPRVLTPLPAVVMGSTEAIRFQRYMELAVSAKYQSWENPLKQPWRLNGYVKEGGYNCCTHWIGNIPIGDKLVKEIILPGENDRPMKARLHKVEIPKTHQALSNIWSYPLHEPLSAVLGLAQKNGQGEFASPGYVIQNLLGVANNERVPIVFYFVNDHRQPIPSAPELYFEEPN